MTLRAHARLGIGSLHLDVALEAAAGQALAIVGPNGAGKSTLVAALAGLVPLETGEVVLDGRILERPAEGIRLPPQERGVGVVFQDRLLFPALSALENVAFGLLAQGLSGPDARRRAMEWLERFDLQAQAALLPRQLSGGQAQRVALARALAVRPRLLLLDEPLVALDVAARRDVRRIVADILAAAEGIKVLVTHDPVDALTLVPQVVVLEAGRVAQVGPPEQVRRRPGSAYVASFVGLNYLPGVLELGPGGPAVRLENGRLRVTDTGLADGAAVVATIHPRAVLLSTDQPQTSARNALPGPVQSIDRLEDRARVTLASEPALTAEVTLEALAALGLVAGSTAWALVKATEIDVAPR